MHLRTNGKCPICNDNFKQAITTACCDKQACKACIVFIFYMN